MLSFSKSIFDKLKDKDIEIYTGDTSKERYYSDFSITDKDVLRGKLVDYGYDMLVLEQNKKFIYINTFSIKTVIELSKEISTADMYQDETKKHK